MKELRNVAILGSTGSIGTQTMEIISIHGGFKVIALAAMGSNLALLEKQVREYKPEVVCVYNEAKANEFRESVRDISVRVVSGMEGLVETASLDKVDLVVSAVVGMIGIRPTIAAITSGKDVALANKETLVTAGHIIMPLVEKHGVSLLPIDSEHSAIFQCLQGRKGPDGHYPHDNSGEVSRILLTASGGPFRGKSYDELKCMTAADALKHPNWSMGKKITIDSASMVNKALEVMEAKWLFGISPEKISVVIQPKSIVHSAVEFADGSIVAQMGAPDMRIPIQYALYYPNRLPSPVERLDLFKIADIHFEKPDYETFKGLKLGLEAIKQGGSICTVFNAANEFAVAKFLAGSISFTGIYELIEAAFASHHNILVPSLEQILEVEKATYNYLEEYLKR